MKMLFVFLLVFLYHFNRGDTVIRLEGLPLWRFARPFLSGISWRTGSEFVCLVGRAGILTFIMVSRDTQKCHRYQLILLEEGSKFLPLYDLPWIKWIRRFINGDHVVVILSFFL